MLIRMEMISPLEIVFLVGLAVWLVRRGCSIGFVVCASLFFVYAWAVLAVTMFPIELDAEFLEEMRRNPRWAENINLRPLGFPDAPHVQAIQIYGNFCLGIPFGFGLPFVWRAMARRVLLVGFCYAIGLEVVQLAIGLMMRFPYRVIDANDVFLVFAGVVVGQVVLWGWARTYRMIIGSRVSVNRFWGHMHEVLMGEDAKNPAE